MKYLSFTINNYRGITNSIIDLKKNSLVPIIGINESGKTSILYALFAFDYINDDERDGTHLKDTKNLYKPHESQDSIVTATIQLSADNLLDILQNNLSFPDESDSNLQDDKNDIEGSDETVTEEDDDNDETNSADDKEKANEDQIQLRKDLLALKKDTLEIKIQRNLTTKKYEFLSDKYSSIQLLAQKVLYYLPYILLNEDFIDRPPQYIEIPKEKPEILSGWLSRFERLFRSTKNNFSIFNLKDKESRVQDDILSDVSNELNIKLIATWETFLLDNSPLLKIKLVFKTNNEENKAEYPFLLEIKVIEEVNGEERSFYLTDRSKGFIWFFNFIMNLEYNPKLTSYSTDTIFLLDEPGSYLHSYAQEKLCKILKDLSKNNSKVIFTTHSHHLLNPEFISYNSIHIVEKDENKNIFLVPINQHNQKKENIKAYQPVLDKLMVPAFEIYNKKDRMILVEGIYDKYTIEMFIDFSDQKTKDEIFVFPSDSAETLIKHIPYFITFSKTYIVIWDNDSAGKKAYKLATTTFGDKEAERFDILPSNNGKNRKMEQMFENNDLNEIASELQMPSNAPYEKIILGLYYSQNRKNIIKKTISTNTRSNFENLKKIIVKRFKKSEEILNFNFN